MSGFDTEKARGRRFASTSELRDACDEIDRLRVTLTATENALREAEHATELATRVREKGRDMSDQAFENTDRELWREVEGDYYSPSIHVTEQGAIGINVGGTVYVRSLREWHEAVREIDRLLDTLTTTEKWLFATQDELVKLTDALRAADALADSLDEFPLRACGLCARETIAALAEYRTILAAARVVVSADPTEED